MARLIKVGEYENDSEVWAAQYLRERLPDEYLILTNVDVYTENGSRLECDQIIIGLYAVYVVEVKGYTGKVTAGKDLWTFDTSHRPYSSAFVKKTRDKAIILRDRMKRRIAAVDLHAPWTQYVIFVTGDRGTNIELEVENPSEPICDPNNIIERLTRPELLTGAHYFGPLSEDQIAVAEREIAAIEELKRIPLQWGAFSEVKFLTNDGPYQISKGTWAVGDFRQEFVLRVLEKSSGRDRATYTQYLNGLVEEASIYRELAGVPGVPYVVPLQEDDERVVFAISWPRGCPLASIDPAALSIDQRIGILRSLASTLGMVHERGMVHGRLDPDWIYVTDGGEIQILNFSASIGDQCPFPPPEAGTGQPRAPGDAYTLARILMPWFGTLTTDGNFQPSRDLGESKQALIDWLSAALETDPAERPRLSDLMRLLRKIELGVVTSSSAVEAPFQRESNALLHGTFRLEDSLGNGSAGEVWRARHERGNYPVALYFPAEGDEAFLRSRFEEIASLHHPMIVRAYDMRRVPGQDGLYMAADWQEGDSLDTIIENSPSIDQTTVLGWMRDLVIALEFVHGQGVLHRNISPDAIVIVQGRPRLVEFSLLPESNSRAGLIEYSDPRVAKTGWCPEADLYALAATFLSLLAGVTPRTSRGVPLEPAQIEKVLPAALPAAIRRGMLNVFSPGFELQTDRYDQLFGVPEPEKPLEKLPDAFLKQWGLALTGHQERIARFMIKEFQEKPGGRARARSQVVKGSLALTDVRGNKTLRAAANSAISTLKTQGVLYSPSGTKAVKPTTAFLSSWKTFKK